VADVEVAGAVRALVADAGAAAARRLPTSTSPTTLLSPLSKCGMGYLSAVLAGCLVGGKAIMGWHGME